MKAQSAVEYLMTYGWSILIIAIIIASLIELGVFNSANSTPNSCIGTTGYSCSGVILYSSGTLIVNFGQVGTEPITITGTACTKNSTLTGLSNIGDVVIQSEQQEQLVFRCPLSSTAVGSKFAGHLWIEYNTQSGQVGIIQEVGSVYASVIEANMTAYAPIAYLAIQSSPSADIAEVNLANYNVINVISTSSSNIDDMELSPDGKYVYFDSNAGNFFALNRESGVISQLYQGTSTLGSFAIAPNGTYAYVIQNPYYSVNVITLSLSGTDSTTAVNTIAFSQSFAAGAITLSQNGKDAYVASSTDLYTINLATDTVVNDIAYAAMSGGSMNDQLYMNKMVLAPNGTNMYIPTGCYGSGAVADVNLETGIATQIGSAIEGCPQELALSPDGKSLYAPNYCYDQFAKLTLSTDSVITASEYFYGCTTAVSLSQNGQYAYVVASGGMFYTVNTTTMTVVNDITIPEGSVVQPMAIYSPITTS